MIGPSKHEAKFMDVDAWIKKTIAVALAMFMISCLFLMAGCTTNPVATQSKLITGLGKQVHNAWEAGQIETDKAIEAQEKLQFAQSLVAGAPFPLDSDLCPPPTTRIVCIDNMIAAAQQVAAEAEK